MSIAASAWAGQLVNPNASPQVKNIYAFLEQARAQGRTISGQLDVISKPGVDSPMWDSKNFLRRVYTATGEWPGVIGAYWDPGRNSNMMINEFANYYSKGGIPHLTSMPRNPRKPGYEREWSADRAVNSDGNNYYVNLGTLLNTGPRGGVYQHYYMDLDNIASKLQILEDRGIPVMFRPLSECNGPWFWWGTNQQFLTVNPDRATHYKQLWKEMYEYFTYTKGLDNLIWVWETRNVPVDLRDKWLHPRDLYPGDDYVDIIAMNSSVKRNEGMNSAVIWREAYDWMKARGKLIAFSQCGPRAAGETEQADNMKVIRGFENHFPEVVWWMAWRDEFSMAWNFNHKAMIAHPRVLNRGDLPDFDENGL